MGIVKSTMDDQPLDGDFRKQFEELIDDSIADAYDEYEEEPFFISAAIFDGERARELLTEMWGDLITKEAIDYAVARFKNTYADVIEKDHKAHAGE